MRVVVFGTFDPLHAGHVDFFRQARQSGGQARAHLTVVVARDSWIRLVKRREPRQSEERRLAEAARQQGVDEVRLGDEWPAADLYRLLGELDFDVLALGYDQTPREKTVREELRRRGKDTVRVVTLQPFQPDEYKSSLVHD